MILHCGTEGVFTNWIKKCEHDHLSTIFSITELQNLSRRVSRSIFVCLSIPLGCFGLVLACLRRGLARFLFMFFSLGHRPLLGGGVECFSFLSWTTVLMVFVCLFCIVFWGLFFLYLRSILAIVGCSKSALFCAKLGR